MKTIRRIGKLYHIVKGIKTLEVFKTIDDARKHLGVTEEYLDGNVNIDGELDKPWKEYQDLQVRVLRMRKKRGATCTIKQQ